MIEISRLVVMTLLLTIASVTTAEEETRLSSIIRQVEFDNGSALELVNESSVTSSMSLDGLQYTRSEFTRRQTGLELIRHPSDRWLLTTACDIEHKSGDKAKGMAFYFEAVRLLSILNHDLE